MNTSENYDVLGRALAKDKAGRGITATEGRMIRDFEQGEIGRDHFLTIASTPMRLPTANLKPEDDSTRTARRLSIEQIDGLQEKLRTGNPDLETRLQIAESNITELENEVFDLETAATALATRVTTLETLLSGFARRSISVCDGGTTKTMTIASTTPA
jgi:hypothetical protein